MAIVRKIDRNAWAVWARWTASMMLGEFAGFAITDVAGALSIQRFPGEDRPGARVAVAWLLVGARTIEGCVLGLAQALALRHYLPGSSTRQWIFLATAAGAWPVWRSYLLACP